MKAFIAVAFLVASVAAQNLDLLQLNKEKSLFKGEGRLVEDLLLKEKLGQHFLTNQEEFPIWGRQQVTLLSLEEIIATPLFREYYNIPLFRQFWEEYPVVFRRYIQSVLFQQFWTIPAFQQYFRNPAYFYKYIVPQVQVVAKTVRQGGDIYGIVNKYNTNQFNQQYESIVEQLINQKYNKYGFNKEFTVPMTQGLQGLEYPTMYGNNDVVNYKFLLDKIYSQLKYGKINGEITETMTDVRALPTGQIVEKTLGKIVDPITGLEKVTVGDVKLVDEKIVPVQTLDFPVEKKFNTIVESELVKDALLKKMYLNKIFGKKINFFPETYETILNKGLYNYEPMMMNKYDSIMYPKTTYGQEFNTNKFISPIVARMYGLNKFNKMNTLPMFTQQYNKMDLFNQFQTEKMIQEIQKEKMIKNQMPFLNKEQAKLFNIFNTEKTIDMEIPKMMETEKFHTIPLTFGKPIIGSGLTDFQKEIKEYQLQKELNEFKY